LADGTSKHLHGTAPAEIEVRKVVAGVKRRAKQHPNEQPARVTASSVGVLGEEVAMAMPERRDLTRQVFYVRIFLGYEPGNFTLTEK